MSNFNKFLSAASSALVVAATIAVAVKAAEHEASPGVREENKRRLERLQKSYREELNTLRTMETYHLFYDPSAIARQKALVDALQQRMLDAY